MRCSLKLVAQFDGFNLHAGTTFEPHERTALERFCRYALRGPLAQARLSARADRKLVYRLKAPKPDGTTHVVFTLMTLLQRFSLRRSSGGSCRCRAST